MTSDLFAPLSSSLSLPLYDSCCASAGENIYNTNKAHHWVTADKIIMLNTLAICNDNIRHNISNYMFLFCFIPQTMQVDVTNEDYSFTWSEGDQEHTANYGTAYGCHHYYAAGFGYGEAKMDLTGTGFHFGHFTQEVK